MIAAEGDGGREQVKTSKGQKRERNVEYSREDACWVEPVSNQAPLPGVLKGCSFYCFLSEKTDVLVKLDHEDADGGNPRYSQIAL